MLGKIFKIVLVLVIVGILVFVGIGFSLPDRYKVERQETINAQPETVYALIERTKAWKDWTIWNQRDPNMTVEYSGPDVGVGSKMAWQSKTEGNGMLTITDSNPPNSLVYLFEMPDMGMSATGRMTLQASEGGTVIVWSDEGEFGNNPIFRYFGLVIEDMIAPDFEAGLGNLKTLAEAKQRETASMMPVPEEISASVAKLKGALGAALMTQVQQEGAAAAVAFCSLEALPLTSEVSQETGKEVARITDMPRNPSNMADAEGLQVLAQMAADKAAGQLKPHYQKGSVYYFPLTIQPLCLTCHGQDLEPSLVAAIDERYPDDQARGYSLDDLRGAIVIK